MTLEIINTLKKELDETKTEEKRLNLWRKYLGKVGIIKKALSNLGKLPIEKRKNEAIAIQKARKVAEELLNNKEKSLKKAISSQELKKQAEKLGFNIPKIGHLHPLTQTIRMMNKFFTNMGYSVMEGPEIETDEFNFQRLNVPDNHPAKEMQDTIYIDEPRYLLRTQTSSIEAHILKDYKPPFKVICPGRSYRNEKVNPSNSFVLHQYQGVVVLDRVSLKDLFGTFEYLFKRMYGGKVVTRYRNKYYPEVEPGVGPDMQCFNCHGKGCRVCKGVGWIEMAGAGIIHPNLLKMGGIDPQKWMGFAFGLGLDRWTMAKYHITDIRTLLSGNLGYKYHENENTLQ